MNPREISTFLEAHGRLLDSHIADVCGFLSDGRLSEICYDYRQVGKTPQEKPFNAFTLVSDKYQLENFHSGILRALLDPSEAHHEGTTFLFAFIDFINGSFPDVRVNKLHYRNAAVKREKGRIDVRILDEESRHCIIIENKMNNAADMQRQMPRYYDDMTLRGFAVDAIVYIPLDATKSPDTSTWSELDKSHVKPLLCVLPAYKESGPSLVNGWLLPCSLKTKNLDNVSIFRQYAETVKSLVKENMNSVILKKFYESLREEKSIESAISVRDMLQELPTYMADRLCEHFRAKAGKYEVWKYKPNFCGILFKIDGLQYKIDIWTSEKGYSVHVFMQEQDTRHLDWADGMKTLESFTNTGTEYRRTDFSFYDEDKVMECVTPVIAEMQEFLRDGNRHQQ